MRVTQRAWTASGGWDDGPPAVGSPGSGALALLFGSKATIANHDLLGEVRRVNPDAHLFGCSTAGEIRGTRVLDDSLVVTTVGFEATRFRGACARLSSPDGYRAGLQLAGALSGADLRHVFVLSDGHLVNGSALVAGLAAGLPRGVSVSGGLAGDGDRFGSTLVIWDDPMERSVAAVGFYGEALRIGCGSLGGWDPFGPERLITKSEGNVLYELDGQPALALYELYLGDRARELPGSALLFPLSLGESEHDPGVVRTILAVDETKQSMTFAGDVPLGSRVRLMKASLERLIDGAAGAARVSRDALGDPSPELGILVSCVGRRMVLGQRVEDEVEGVRDALGSRAVLSGFYSYGEIAPRSPPAPCEFHNQTMTVTTLAEI